MRAKVLLSLVGATIAAVALVSASGAATTRTQKVIRLDVSTRAAVIHYLRSIHVKAKGAVIQRGSLNYAGARCPGAGWTCGSTKHTVVQITGHGGQNRFACRSAHCVVVQISGVSRGVFISGRQLAAKGGGGGNTASCVKTGSGATTGTGQSCVISQSGTGKNTAVVYENSSKVSGLLAAAAYTASITQQVASGNNDNQACVLQSINLDGSTTGLKTKPVAVTLDGHQSVKIKQDVAGNGTNYANQAALLNSGGTTASCDPNGAILQSQTITSTVNATAGITQNENSSSMLCGDGTTTGSARANLCIDIEQNQNNGSPQTSTATGPNHAAFDQESQLFALANTTAGQTVTQTQGNSLQSVGGLSGKINQNSQGGFSDFTGTQNETQCEDAFKNTTLPTPTNTALCTNQRDAPSGITVTQTQYGPEGVGKPKKTRHSRILFSHVDKDPTDSSQTGNNSDTFTVNQSSKQTNDSNNTQNNHVTGGLTTSGDGTVNQNVTLQGAPKVDVQSGTNTTVSSTIDCTSYTLGSCTKTLSAPTIVNKPSNPTAYGASDASFTFSNPDPTVQFVCELDTATVYTLCTGDGSGSFSSPNLPSGSHTLSVKTMDADNSNTSAGTATYSWVITPPDPTITASSKPANPSAYNTSGSFQFTDADPTAIFKCKLDGESTYTACTSGSVSTNLASGSHSFSVKAYDSTGTYVSNNDDHYSWVITPPDPTITPSSKPASPSAYSTSGSFQFTDDDPTAIFECKLDGASTYTACTSGTVSTNLASGSHSFSVKAYDSTGTYVSNNDDHYSWVITPPDPTISSGPGSGSGSQVTSTDATFAFSDDDSTAKFECKLDDAASYTACPSTNLAYSGLSHGPHTLDVKATDSNGAYESIGFAEYTWEVIPYLTFEVTPDGATAGWSGTPGASSITLTTGSDPGTYAQFTIHDRNDLTVDDLTAEPTFTTDTYSGGAPRYEIDFENGDYVFGYPSQAGDGTDSWQLVCNGGCVTGGMMSWGDVQTAEPGQTVTDVLIEVDYPANAPYNISDFTFDGYDLSFFND